MVHCISRIHFVTVKYLVSVGAAEMDVKAERLRTSQAAALYMYTHLHKHPCLQSECLKYHNTHDGTKEN